MEVIARRVKADPSLRGTHLSQGPSGTPAMAANSPPRNISSRMVPTSTGPLPGQGKRRSTSRSKPDEAMSWHGFSKTVRYTERGAADETRSNVDRQKRAAHVPLLLNRPSGVKHFQTIHRCGVDVAHGLALLFGIGTKALPVWDSRTRWNNLWGGIAVLLDSGSKADLSASVPKPDSMHSSNRRFLLRSRRKRGRATSVARNTPSSLLSASRVAFARHCMRSAVRIRCRTTTGHRRTPAKLTPPPHADEWRTWPAGDPQGNQSDASHAGYGHCDAGKLLAQQQLPDE